jgi:hypothetical protein
LKKWTFEMLENPVPELLAVPSHRPAGALPSHAERDAIISELHRLIDSVITCDNALLISGLLDEFMMGFQELGSSLPVDVIQHVLTLLVPSPFDSSQTVCLRLLMRLLHHPGLTDLLISSEALFCLTHDAYWGATLVRTKALVLEFVGYLLREGASVVEYFAQIGLLDLLYRQYEERRGRRPADLPSVSLLRELTGAAQALAQFPHLLAPSDHVRLVDIAGDVLERHAEGPLPSPA